jgi:hypothetical protein
MYCKYSPAAQGVAPADFWSINCIFASTKAKNSLIRRKAKRNALEISNLTDATFLFLVVLPVTFKNLNQ